MKKETWIAVSIVAGVVALSGLWLGYESVSVNTPPSHSNAPVNFDPVPVYPDNERPQQDDVTRIIISDQLNDGDVDINQVLSDKVIVDDEVVSRPEPQDP